MEQGQCHGVTQGHPSTSGDDDFVGNSDLEEEELVRSTT